MSLENVCGFEKEQIVLSLQNNRLLTDARSHLVCLYLLHDALCLPAVESIYKSALHHIASQAETRKPLVYEDIQQQSFSQVRTSLSIFNCNLSILSSHMAIIGPGDVLKTLKDVCLRFINSTCEEYDHKLDEALVKDDFDAVVTVLGQCEGMLEHPRNMCRPEGRKCYHVVPARKCVRERFVTKKRRVHSSVTSSLMLSFVACSIQFAAALTSSPTPSGLLSITTKSRMKQTALLKQTTTWSRQMSSDRHGIHRRGKFNIGRPFADRFRRSSMQPSHSTCP